MRLAHLGLLIVTLALSGCAPQTQHISETLSVALFGVSDERATVDYAQTLPYASLFASLDNAPHALLVLAWDEPGQHDALALKWISAQQELIVTEAGRITKTVNLVVGNIQHLYANEPDPLSQNLLLDSTPRNLALSIELARYSAPSATRSFDVYYPSATRKSLAEWHPITDLGRGASFIATNQATLYQSLLARSNERQSDCQ
ncbi:YjbF family lipoprotein [Vibrio metschnikovii]